MSLNEDRDKRKDDAVRRELSAARRLHEAATHRMNEANLVLESATERYNRHFGSDDNGRGGG